MLEKYGLDDLIREIVSRGFCVTFSAVSPQVNLDNKGVVERDSFEKKKKSYTLGGKAKEFSWFVSGDSLVIDRGAGIRNIFLLDDLLALLEKINNTFNGDYFCLGNDVQKLKNNNEVMGLGRLIYAASEDISQAQSASQLIVIFKEVGIFETNHKKRGIMARLVNLPVDLKELRVCLSQTKGA